MCSRNPRRSFTKPESRLFDLSLCMHIALHEVSRPLRPPSLDFSPQLPTLSHLPRLLLCSREFRGLGITRGQPAHFARIRNKSPNQLLKPRMADVKCPSPRTTRRPVAITTSEPLKDESPDHLRFPTAAPSAGSTPSLPRSS